MTPVEIAIPFVVLAVLTVFVVVYIIRSAMRERLGREARLAAKKEPPDSQEVD